jgi:hypothetical protein
MQDVKRIESYGLGDFCQDVENALKEGYSFDFTTNENFPTAFGTLLTCGLVKTIEAEVELEKVEDDPVSLPPEADPVEAESTEGTAAEPTEDTTAVKRGPKAKNK